MANRRVAKSAASRRVNDFVEWLKWAKKQYPNAFGKKEDTQKKPSPDFAGEGATKILTEL